MLNKIRENLNYARPYSIHTLVFTMVLLITYGLARFPSLHEFFIALLLISLFSGIYLYFLGCRTKKEYNNIISIIDNIRKNKFETPDEIKLNESLFALEDSIRSMFFRTQTDIRKLEKLQQVRTEFLGNVSHELRTPIFAIQGFLETLYNGAIDDPKVNHSFLKKAILHTNNLNNLLNDLIDISRIESGDMGMSFQYFNIYNFLEGIVNEFKSVAEKKNIMLRMGKIPRDLSLYGDAARLRQVFTNLIQNAIKYSERGIIEIIVEEEENFGKISVKDTGIGISEQDLGRIFERFYRVDKGRSRAAGGTGLGLAIVKHIIEAHKSKVEVKSKLGFGTEFSFRLKKIKKEENLELFNH